MRLVDINLILIILVLHSDGGSFMKDASRFIDAFEAPISQSAPHIHQENSWPLSSTELYLEFLIK
jgi:hypothetical protein